MTPFLSIIIPVFNESGNIGPLLDYLLEKTDTSDTEIIVVDGGSTDNTLKEVHDRSVKSIQSPKASRAVQMNIGARASSGEFLYFVHADTLPPTDFIDCLKQAKAEGKKLACFRFRFDSKSWILAVNSFFTRFNFDWCRGGDQTLFVCRKLFTMLDGYNEDYSIMEEYDFLIRAEEKTSLSILPRAVKVSARKYNNNSWFKVQMANLRAFRQFRSGIHPDVIKENYKSALNPH